MLSSNFLKVLFAFCLISVSGVAEAQTMGGAVLVISHTGVFQFGTETLTLNGGFPSSSGFALGGTAGLLGATGGSTINAGSLIADGSI